MTKQLRSPSCASRQVMLTDHAWLPRNPVAFSPNHRRYEGSSPQSDHLIGRGCSHERLKQKVEVGNRLPERSVCDRLTISRLDPARALIRVTTMCGASITRGPLSASDCHAPVQRHSWVCFTTPAYPPKNIPTSQRQRAATIQIQSLQPTPNVSRDNPLELGRLLRSSSQRGRFQKRSLPTSFPGRWYFTGVRLLDPSGPTGFYVARNSGRIEPVRRH